MLISIAIPCYYSAKNLPIVVDDIREAFAEHPEHDYQIVLVNDGSKDDTFKVISELCECDRKITGVDLSRNFGQASARMASLPYIEGECAVFMDDDGQHPAKELFRLVDKLDEGYDVVMARLRHKKHSIFKRVTSAMSRKIAEFIGNRPKEIIYSSFFAASRLVIDELQKYKSPFPSAMGYAMHVTERFANVDIEHHERISGHSGYNLKRLLALWLNGVTNFTLVPLRVASLLGFFTAAAGFLMGIYFVVRKLVFPQTLSGYTSIISVILLIGGIIMVLLGLIGEYVGRIYMTISNMPQFAIREVRNKRCSDVKHPVTSDV